MPKSTPNSVFNTDSTNPTTHTPNTPKTREYDALDLYDAHSLAECDLNWAALAINDLRKRAAKIQEHPKTDLLAKLSFGELIEFAYMYEYLIGQRQKHHRDQAEAYDQERKQDMEGK